MSNGKVMSRRGFLKNIRETASDTEISKTISKGDVYHEQVRQFDWNPIGNVSNFPVESLSVISGYQIRSTELGLQAMNNQGFYVLRIRPDGLIELNSRAFCSKSEYLSVLTGTMVTLDNRTTSEEQDNE